MTDTQAVADSPDAQSATVADEAGAQDDLDQLLDEFKPGPDSEPERKETEDKQTVERLERLEQELVRRDVDSAVREIASDIADGTPADSELADDWLNARARKDPRVLEAFQQRSQNPAKWAKVQGGLKREFQKKFASQPDQETSDAKQAVEAAVRGASTKAPDESGPDFSRMSDGELQQWKRHNAR